MKLCKRCNIAKGEGLFNKNKHNRDGLQSRCKACQVDANREWAARRPEVRRSTLRRQYQTECSLGRRESKKVDKTQHRAHCAVYLAKKAGLLTKPNKCSLCGSENHHLHAHHDDYSKPLEIRWVCPPCHGHIHRAEKTA